MTSPLAQTTQNALLRAALALTPSAPQERVRDALLHLLQTLAVAAAAGGGTLQGESLLTGVVDALTGDGDGR